MKVLYFDCKSGISGDMFVGSMLDLGAKVGIKKSFLANELKKLKLKNYAIEIKTVKKKGIDATKFDVICGKEHKHRYLKEINKMIDNSNLSLGVKKLSKAIFLTLGKAEAKAHATTINEVHFHEVGAIDSIIDIVAAAIMFDKLGIRDVYCSRLREGHGKVQISHGEVNLPVPAVKEILKNDPIEIINVGKELITPTGAAIIKTITTEFLEDDEFAESFLLEKKSKEGVGAGTRDLEFPNILRCMIVDKKYNFSKKVMLETNIDDMNPEIFQYVIQKVMEKGAIDAFIENCIMKKDRSGTKLSVLCDEGKKDEIIETIFRETSTLGIRINNITRAELNRELETIKTKYGPVKIKKSYFNGKLINDKPEFNDCKMLALKNNVSIHEIYKEVQKHTNNTDSRIKNSISGFLNR